MRCVSTFGILIAVVGLPGTQGSLHFESLVATDSLTGWVVDRPGADRASASQGVLRLNKKAGWLRTERTDFGEFTLRFDVRSGGSTKALLGLFGLGPFKGSPGLVSVVPLLGDSMPGAGDFGNMRLSVFTPNHAAVNAALRSDDEWQSYEVRREGNLVSVLLNGTPILKGLAGFSLSGWLGFLVPDGSITLRHIQIAEVPVSPTLPGGIYRVMDGVTIPRVVREVRPNYTSEARAAGIQGVAVLEAVVDIDGSLGRIGVVRSLDPQFGLDDEAIKAVRQWRFIPGRFDGKPVPVLISIEMTFTLGGK